MSAEWEPDPLSRCQRVQPYKDPARGWEKPNGTIRCDIAGHGVNEPAPDDLSFEEHICWIADHAPPLPAAMKDRLRALSAETRSGA